MNVHCEDTWGAKQKAIWRRLWGLTDRSQLILAASLYVLIIFTRTLTKGHSWKTKSPPFALFLISTESGHIEPKTVLKLAVSITENRITRKTRNNVLHKAPLHSHACTSYREYFCECTHSWPLTRVCLRVPTHNCIYSFSYSHICGRVKWWGFDDQI